MFRVRTSNGKWLGSWRKLIKKKLLAFLRVLPKELGIHGYGEEDLDFSGYHHNILEWEIWVTIQKDVLWNEGEVIEKQKLLFLSSSGQSYERQMSDENDSERYCEYQSCGPLLCLKDYPDGEPFAIVTKEKMWGRWILLITVVKRYRKQDMIHLGFVVNDDDEFEKEFPDDV